MKKLAMALAAGTMLIGLAAPAEAAITRPNRAPVTRYRDRRFHECYERSPRPGHAPRRGDCYDDRRPQHDGQDSVLY